MKFHTFQTMCGSGECSRQMWQSPFADLTEKIAKGFQGLLVSNSNIYKPFPKFDVMMDWWKVEEKTVAVYNMHSSDWVFGAATLILTGEDSEEERKACSNWQGSIYNEGYQSPIPALEIEDRPLFYTVLYRFKENVSDEWWKHYIQSINYMNAIGLAFVRSVQQCGRVL